MDSCESSQRTCGLICPTLSIGFQTVVKRILITGGSGLLGLNWAIACKDIYQVTLGLHTRQVELKGVDYCSPQIDTKDALAATLDKIKPDLVVHAAGMTNIEQCEANPGMARHANVVLAENVATVCAKSGVALAHISTDHLFTESEPMVQENHPVSPLNVYGKTKAEAEQCVLREHPHALVIRTNFYGWGPAYRRSFSDFIFDSLRVGKPVSLFRDVYYTPILIESMVQAVHQLIDRNASGIFNVVGDERVSKYEFGIGLAKVFDFDPNLIQPINLDSIPELVARPKDMSLSNRLACQTLGRHLGSIQEQLCGLRQQSRHPLRLQSIPT
jgi:dTDP-4-dehydrorhamnose reductase